MDKVYCYLCDELNDVIVKSGKEIHIIKGTSVDCEVENAYCQRCGSIVYVPELNDAKLDRMDRAYREQQGIISVPEIKAILERYNIGAKPLATILGWGEITVLRYLKGQIPDQAHSVALSSLQDRRIFKNYFEAKKEKLTKAACAKILIAMDKLEKKTDAETFELELYDRPNGLVMAYSQPPNIYNGFTSFDLEKTIQAILFFIQHGSRLYITMMNKLLWYTDMLCYKLTERQTITGLVYKHHQYGPVPRWWDFLYGSLDDVYITLVEDEYGTYMQLLDEPDTNVFSEDELQVLETVARKFESWSSNRISKYSHLEKAYRETNVGENISFEYARDLSLIIEGCFGSSS